MNEFYPRLSKKLNEISVSNIKSYVAATGGSKITVDEIRDEVIGVDDKKRNDIITKQYIDSITSPKTKQYMLDFLQKSGVPLDKVDEYQIPFRKFWKFQVELYQYDESNKEKKTKTGPVYEFSEDNINILNKFYEDNGKLGDFDEFIKNIPGGQIKDSLNKFFEVLAEVVTGAKENIHVVKGKITDEEFDIDQQTQEEWKKDMLEYLFKFHDINELNEGTFYKEKLLKSGTFINSLFYTNAQGVGRGELLICYTFKGATAQGGSKAYDVVLLNGKKYEVKEYIKDKGGIRLGTEGKLTRFPFWKKIVRSVDVATDMFYAYEDELKASLSEAFFEMWGYVVNDEKIGDSYAKAVSAGVAAGEMGGANLNILKMWYYMAHELVTKKDYQDLNVPEEVVNELNKLYYVKHPEQLDDDLEKASDKYFEQNPELDAFIVYRPDKVNIVEKGGFSFSTITQAAVKFLETELTTKTKSKAKTAFEKWKSEINKVISQQETVEDKKALNDIMKGISLEDFYYKEQEEEHDVEYAEKSKQEKLEKYQSKLKDWNKRKTNLENNPKKTQKEKDKWYKDNPMPELKESIKFYPRLKDFVNF